MIDEESTHPQTEPVTTISKELERPESFRQRLADAYINYRQMVQEEIIPVWRPGDHGIQTFGEPGIDYYVSILSVVGFDPRAEKGDILTQLNTAIEEYKEKVSKPEYQKAIKEAANLVNDYAEQLGLEKLGDFSPYNFFLVPADRITKLSGNSAERAIALIRDDYILYPIESLADEKVSSETNRHNITHEMLHDLRRKNGLLGPTMYDPLEEGITEMVANKLAPEQTPNNYLPNVWIAQELTGILGEEIVVGTHRHELAAKFGERYRGTPYGQFLYEIHTYVKTYEVYNTMLVHQVATPEVQRKHYQVAATLKDQTKQMCDKYGFSYPTGWRYFLYDNV